MERTLRSTKLKVIKFNIKPEIIVRYASSSAITTHDRGRRCTAAGLTAEKAKKIEGFCCGVKQQLKIVVPAKYEPV